MSWDQIRQQIDTEAERSIEQLQRLIQLPSVAARNEGLDACAEHLAKELEAIGLAAQIFPTSICPMVFGQSEQRPDRPTLLLTSHYDVQPPEPIDAWSYPPYAATREDDRIIGRGATDAKGNLVAVLAALRAIRQVLGDYPLNIKVLFDGAEEQGSPQIDEFFAAHHQDIRADAVLTFDAGFVPTDHPFIWLGSSGMLNLEIIATGTSKDLHSSRARLTPHAGWDLVHALATLRDKSGKITIDGFYERVRKPNAAERAAIEAHPWDDAAYMGELGVTAFPDGLSGSRALERLLFEPSLTITGLQSGYAGQGSKEVLPSSAVAKLEFRLVQDQTADDVFDLVDAHWKRLAMPNLVLNRLASTDPTQSPLDSAIVQALQSAAQTVYDKQAAIKPRHESSGRQAIWLAQNLGVPGAISGVGPPNWRGHAPDEFILISYFINGIKYVAATVQEFARRVATDRESV